MTSGCTSGPWVSCEPLSALFEVCKRGLNLSKETHPFKTYRLHAEECCKLVSELVKEVYSYPEDLAKFALLFSELHDVGKLLPEWSLSQEERPYHAIEGAEWLLREGFEPLMSSPYREVLAYAIITHHSPLRIGFEVEKTIERAERIKRRHFDKYFKCRALLKALNSLLKKMEKGVRFDLADAIGIVKLADVISAKSLPMDRVLRQYHWPSGLEEELTKGISKRARERRGLFDRSKFEKQMEIASSGRRHLLIAAPTGWGKTVLALIRMIKLKPIKVFYVLPTITAIKDFYDTFTEILDEEYVGEYFYFADVELMGRREPEEEGLLDVYRYFIPKITVTTMDQLLLTLLQAGKYHVRRFNLRNSLLIFDEFHLLTPKMMACLRAFSKDLLKHYNASCLFMSATPSPYYSSLLKGGLPQLEAMVLCDEYRRLKRHKIEDHDEEIEDFVAEKQDLLRKERTLVIANTVSEAQRVYRSLKKSLGSSRNVVLIHGDFAYKDRARKEGQIEKADVLVSTQVAEVSLDVSFDLLVTELSPIPSLVQRFGRVNRYGGEPRMTNVFICKPEDYAPYGKMLIDLARENLPMLLRGLEQRGEEVYLNEEFWQYEQVYVGEVEKVEEKVSEAIDKMLDFFSFTASERDILEMLGREETYLAIPKIYLEEALNLRRRLEELKGTGHHEERMKIYAQIKKCLVPASRSDVRRADWSDELRLPIIEDYDEEVGIVRC